ncbi:MAG TPA: DUF4199 domain-containing protein [Bacteroidia bacterium]|nr:DUF4199 domain-containing protein [Bacteroidia bacterium]
MKKNILVFGTISGVIVSTFMAISMALMASNNSDMEGATGGMIIGYASMAVAFSFVFVGIKNFRDKQNGGTISFGKSFLLGLMISLIASTMYVITWAVEYHYFLPDFMDKYAVLQVKQLTESGVSGPELEESIKRIESASYNYKHSAFFFTLYTYMEILPVGILITLISSLILKRKTPKNKSTTIAS